MTLKIDSEAIAKLDLSAIKRKLMHQSGEAWSQAHADAVEVEYRRFLYLAKKYPDKQTAPSVDVDRFWHHHILDTKKYARDCNDVFGYFLHHYPYLGIGGVLDEGARDEGARLMRELYEQTFGESYIKATPDHGVNRTSAPAGYWTFAPRGARAAVTGQPAYCTVEADTEGPAFAAQPAYCTFAGQPGVPSRDAQPAYCTFTAETGTHSQAAQPAYCTFAAEPAVPSPTTRPAYCTFAGEPAGSSLAAQHAYCTFAAEPPTATLAAQAAYCTFAAESPIAAGRSSTSQTAYCTIAAGAAVRSQEVRPAFGARHSAYCTIAGADADNVSATVARMSTLARTQAHAAACAVQ